MNKSVEEYLAKVNAETEERLRVKGLDIDKAKREYSSYDKFTSRKGDFTISEPK